MLGATDGCSRKDETWAMLKMGGVSKSIQAHGDDDMMPMISTRNNDEANEW
jgi:hypothetical protein